MQLSCFQKRALLQGCVETLPQTRTTRVKCCLNPEPVMPYVSVLERNPLTWIGATSFFSALICGLFIGQHTTLI